MNWTKEQQEAIELRDKNILVAAAAGSGKTAVLVERIKRLILEEKCAVDRMLIVTFTNAAAAEMKEKIHKALSGALDEAAASETSREDMLFLKKQLDILGTANISTFHSFALDVIRRYFYLIDIEPNFKICDNTQEALLKGEAMDRLLEELFEEADPQFFHFLKCYSGDRDESRFKDIVSTCYDTIRALPEPFEWLNASIEQLKDGKSLASGPAGACLFNTANEKIEAARTALDANRELAELFELPQLETLNEKDGEQIKMLEEALQSGDYETLRNAISAFKLPTMSSKIFANAADPDDAKAAVSDNRNDAKAQIKDLKSVYFSGSMEELCRELHNTYESGLYLQEILRRYDALYSGKKAEKNMADFGDIEHFAYEILKDDEAAAFYRNKFKHIFIDEYQDSNVIQEALVDLIKRPNNLFMVGDVKQSIYKFRLAEPEIFQKKYRDYDSGNVPESVKIDLNKNFRSKRPIIDFINGLCGAVMDGYDDKAALYAGDIHADKSYSSPLLYLAQVPWDENADIDDELKSMMKAEKEALSAVKIIADSLGKPIFDSKKNLERPLEKKDIVILMRGVKSYGDIFYKVLAENNIPSYIDDNDGFFDTMEVNSFLSALYIIDNPKQDIHLLTLLRSEMMGFSIEELVQVRIGFKQGSYYDAFFNYAQAGGDEALREKCASALDTINKWRELSLIMPLNRLIWKLLLDTGFYIVMGAMPAGTQRQANLRALTDKALAYREAGGGTLYGFIRYIEAIKDNKVSMGQVKLLGEKDDLVRIMTVHKSKGLEFPMVLMAGFCRKLNYSTAGKAPAIHKDLGIGFPLVDPQNRWYRKTLLQNMIRDRVHKEEVDEEKRVLYVALTRAKDVLVLLGMCNDADKEATDVLSGRAKDTSYFTMTGKVIGNELGALRHLRDEQLVGFSKGRRRNIKRIMDFIDATDSGEVSPEIERLMDFEYPYAHDLTLKSKYSVSELNSSGRKPIETLAEPAFAAASKNISAVTRGTIYHAVLEHMDIAKARDLGEAYVRELLAQMVRDEMLLAEEAEIVDASRIANFADSQLGRRIAESTAVYKEKPFALLTEHEGKQITVQGIIDCFFEETDGLVLVDYKTGGFGLTEGGESIADKRYRVQIELYKKALESAMSKPVKEAYLYMTDTGKIIKMQ